MQVTVCRRNPFSYAWRPQHPDIILCVILHTVRWLFCSCLVVSGDSVSSCYQEKQADVMFLGDAGSISERQAIKQLYCHFTCSDIIPALQYRRLFPDIFSLSSELTGWISNIFDGICISWHCNCLQDCHRLHWQSPKAVTIRWCSAAVWRVRAGPTPLTLTLTPCCES